MENDLIIYDKLTGKVEWKEVSKKSPNRFGKVIEKFTTIGSNPSGTYTYSCIKVMFGKGTNGLTMNFVIGKRKKRTQK